MLRTAPRETTTTLCLGLTAYVLCSCFVSNCHPIAMSGSDHRLCYYGHVLFQTATLCLGLTTDFSSMFMVAAFHGAIAGGYHSQKTSVTSEFVPITLVSDAVGFIFFFEGFGSLVAAPLFGEFI